MPDTARKMLSEPAIRRELRAAERELKSVPFGSRREAELYATQQALAWVLGEAVMAPVKCALVESEVPAHA